MSGVKPWASVWVALCSRHRDARVQQVRDPFEFHVRSHLPAYLDQHAFNAVKPPVETIERCSTRSSR
jgi:hypothetical protein